MAAPNQINFTTGPATLPDVGTLSYNGCTFSSLFETNVSGKVVQDNAVRTTKLMEYTITADGYVTLPTNLVGLADGVGTVSGVMDQLRRLLTAQAGALVYRGRGMDIVVNQPGSTVQDVAWGPVPELIDFQPLGAGRSAKIKWAVKVRICEGGNFNSPILQFNEETGVTYDEAGYSTLSARGTLEIALTRPTQSSRVLTRTVDDYRQEFISRYVNVDLTRFRVVRREFNVSRDKRTMEWDFSMEELPYMGLPPMVTIARGSYSVRPARQGMGMVSWLCSLRVTYTVRKDKPRRVAWDAFLALLRLRMSYSVLGIGGLDQPQNPAFPNLAGQALNQLAGSANLVATAPLNLVNGLFGNTYGQIGQIVGQQVNAVQGQQNAAPPNQNARPPRCFLMDFNIDEGLYLDSKTTTFSATWRLITQFSEILLASGLWRKVATDGGNFWALSVQDISNWQSWEANRLNPADDIIIDFGGGQQASQASAGRTAV